MKSLKIISLLLAALLCLPLLAACAESGGNTSGTRPPNGGSEDVGNFVEADYKGEKFTFLHIRQFSQGKDYYGGKFLDAETVDGKTVEDAVWERNSAVEARFNVVVDEKIIDDQDPANYLQEVAFADTYDYDVIYGWGVKMGACIPSGYFTDLSVLPNIDLEQEYWSPSATEDLSINGKLYMTINDISMNKLEWGSLIFFNKQIVDDFNVLDSFGGKTFYELVNNGEWTIDEFLKAVTLVSHDELGDGVDKDDIYGLLDGDASGASFGYSCGIDLTSKAEDGSYDVAYYSANNVSLVTKIHDVLSDSRYVKTYKEVGENADVPEGTEIHEYYRSYFKNGHSLFCTGTAQITGEFRAMDYDYGVVPFPKLNADQQNYISTMDHLAAIFAVPATNRKDGVTTASHDRTGAILEYMAYKSNQMVLPQYYEIQIKGQRLSSPEDQAMLDIVRDNIRYVFATMLTLEESNDLNLIEKNYVAMCNNPGSASSTNRTYSRRMEAALDDFYLKVLSLES